MRACCLSCSWSVVGAGRIHVLSCPLMSSPFKTSTSFFLNCFSLFMNSSRCGSPHIYSLVRRARSCTNFTGLTGDNYRSPRLLVEFSMLNLARICCTSLSAGSYVAPSKHRISFPWLNTTTKKCLVKHKKHVQIDHGGFIEIIARVQFVVSWLLRLIAAPYVRMVGQEHQARPELVRTFWCIFCHRLSGRAVLCRRGPLWANIYLAIWVTKLGRQGI